MSHNIDKMTRFAASKGVFQMRKIFKSIVVLALVAVMLCSSAMAASYGAKVLTNTMTVYNSSKQAAGALIRGTEIKVKGISGDWARISYNGKTGYAKLSGIIFNKKIPAIATSDTAIRFVTRESWNKNQYYSATLAAGSGIYVVGKNGSEALVSNGDGSAIGYVKLSALKKA